MKMTMDTPNKLLDPYTTIIRLLICPTLFLRILLRFILFTCLTTAIFLALGGPSWVESIYFVAAVLLLILNMTVYPQFALLASNKTLMLCGKAPHHLLIGLWCLITLTSIIVGRLVSEGLVKTTNYSTGFLATWALLSLIIYGSCRLRFDLNFAVFLTIAFTGIPDWLSQTPTATEAQPILWFLVMAGLGAQAHLYRAVHRHQLKAPLMIIGNSLNDTQKKSYFNPLRPLFYAGFKPGKHPSTIHLLMDSSDILRDFFIKAIGITLLLCSALYFATQLEFWRFPFAGNLVEMASILLLIPALMIMDKLNVMSLNARRLWLILPGDRWQALKFIERQSIKICALGMMPFVFAALAPMVLMGYPVLLSLFYAGLILIALYFFQVTQWLSLTQVDYWAHIIRFLLAMTLVPISFVLWPPSNLQKVFLLAGITVVLLGVALALRHWTYKLWRTQDLSKLRDKKAVRI